MSAPDKVTAGGMEAGAESSSALTFTKHVKKKLKSYEAPTPLAPIADTHAHLTCFWGKDPARALARAALAGDRMLITLLDPVSDGRDAAAFHDQLVGWMEGARQILAAQGAGPACAVLLDNVRYLCGVHPYGAPDYTDAVHEQVLAALDDPLCAGVGEIGLDYHFDASNDVVPAPHDVQIACFERQLAVAVERDLPVELHLRNDPADPARTAHADAYDVLQRTGLPQAGCILHCFTEDRATMDCFVDLGCCIAFGGAATFKRNEPIREAFAACPTDRLLFETDCPYMAPEPLRGSECEPAMIAFTADALCRDRAVRTGEDPADIARAAYENARRIFCDELA